MRRCLKTTIFMTLVMSLLVTNLIVAAEPTVTVDPETPEAESTVTFTAVLDDDDVISVWLDIRECSAILCFPGSIQNLSMTEQADGSYETSATLTYDTAIYIQYTLFVESSEGWNEYLSETKVYLAEKQNGDGTTNGDNGNGGGGIPGFEIIGLLTAVVISIIILRRKRF